MVDKVIPELSRYSRIFLLLDNDQAGNQATELLKKSHPHASDSRKILGSCKDVNEWIKRKYVTDSSFSVHQNKTAKRCCSAFGGYF
jgi:DNA primase